MSVIHTGSGVYTPTNAHTETKHTQNTDTYTHIYIHAYIQRGIQTQNTDTITSMHRATDVYSRFTHRNTNTYTTQIHIQRHTDIETV